MLEPSFITTSRHTALPTTHAGRLSVPLSISGSSNSTRRDTRLVCTVLHEMPQMIGFPFRIRRMPFGSRNGTNEKLSGDLHRSVTTCGGIISEFTNIEADTTRLGEE